MHRRAQAAPDRIVREVGEAAEATPVEDKVTKERSESLSLASPLHKQLSSYALGDDYKNSKYFILSR